MLGSAGFHYRALAFNDKLQHLPLRGVSRQGSLKIAARRIDGRFENRPSIRRYQIRLTLCHRSMPHCALREL